MNANFLFVSDDKYVKNLGVCTYSVMHNMCPNVDKVKIFIMDCGITEENKAKLIKQTQRFNNAEIIFHDINTLLDSVMPKFETWWHRSIYGRLFLNEILDRYEKIDETDGIDRIIYLDSDIIMNQPVTELFEMDLHGKCLAGVVDSDEVSRKRKLKMSDESRYINSGVLVIDAKRWRELDAGRRIIEYINSFPEELLYPDQDAINYILSEEIITIPLEYNFMLMICDRDIPKMFANLEISYTYEEIHHALHNVKVMHFAGHDMWSMYGPTAIPSRIFVKYKKLSDWRDCRRKFHSVPEFFICLCIFIKRKIYRD